MPRQSASNAIAALPPANVRAGLVACRSTSRALQAGARALVLLHLVRLAEQDEDAAAVRVGARLGRRRGTAGRPRRGPSAYCAWYSFSGVARSGSRRAQKIFWNSRRSALSFRSLYVLLLVGEQDRADVVEPLLVVLVELLGSREPRATARARASRIAERIDAFACVSLLAFARTARFYALGPGSRQSRVESRRARAGTLRASLGPVRVSPAPTRDAPRRSRSSCRARGCRRRRPAALARATRRTPDARAARRSPPVLLPASASAWDVAVGQAARSARSAARRGRGRDGPVDGPRAARS